MLPAAAYEVTELARESLGASLVPGQRWARRIANLILGPETDALNRTTSDGKTTTGSSLTMSSPSMQASIA